MSTDRIPTPLVTIPFSGWSQASGSREMVPSIILPVETAIVLRDNLALSTDACWCILDIAMTNQVPAMRLLTWFLNSASKKALLSFVWSFRPLVFPFDGPAQNFT